MILDVACPGCGDEEVQAWRENETVETDEVYVTCRGTCGREWPKKFIDSGDSRRVEEIAREIIGV